jgi:hypothetical protein
MTTPVWSQPSHDGSTRSVPNPNPRHGDKAAIFLRVPHISYVSNAWVHVISDSEPELVRAVVDRQDKPDTWLRA